MLPCPAGGLGETLLQDFALGTLMLPPAQWAAVATPAIAQHVHLAHVGARRGSPTRVLGDDGY